MLLSGGSRIMSPQCEDAIANTAQQLADVGLPLSKAQLPDVARACTALFQEPPSAFSVKWVHNFSVRHPGVVLTTTSRSMRQTPPTTDSIHRFFASLQATVLDTHFDGAMPPAGVVWSVAEARMPLSQLTDVSRAVVDLERRSRALGVLAAAGGRVRDGVSVVVAGSAAGGRHTPLVVLRGDAVDDSWAPASMTAQGPPAAHGLRCYAKATDVDSVQVAATPSGVLTAGVFADWVGVFVRERGCSRDKKHLLFVEGVELLVHRDTAAFAEDNGLIIVDVPHGVLQPLSDHVLHSLQAPWESFISQYVTDIPRCCCCCCSCSCSGLLLHALPLGCVIPVGSDCGPCRDNDGVVVVGGGVFLKHSAVDSFS